MPDTESDAPQTGTLSNRLDGWVRSTLSVSSGAVRRRDSSGVLVIVTLLYLGAFLWAIGDLRFQSVGFDLLLVNEPFARTFESAPGAYIHEPIALVDLWVVRLLFSPLNVLLGFVISALAGLNLALSYLAVTQPKSCGVGATTGVFASIPALLAGSACCAPVLFIVLGITASSTLLTLFTWLLPIAVGLLLASLVYLTGKIDPNAV